MSALAWLILVVVVVVVVIVAIIAVQARRRRGGVIVDPNRSRRPRRHGVRDEPAHAGLGGHQAAGRDVRGRGRRADPRHRLRRRRRAGRRVSPSAGRGLFAGPLKQSLPWGAVQALGADAVMITDESALASPEALLGDAEAAAGGPGGDVLGSRVLTDSGTDLGKVVDVIIEVAGPAEQCDVVGYEIEASEALSSDGTRLLIPLPDTLAASGEHLMVPAAAKDFVRDDLAGFGAAVLEFRARFEGSQREGGATGEGGQ